jgi:hypothetical protein
MEPDEFEPRPVEEALANLHRSGSRISDCAVVGVDTKLAWIVSGRNGDNQVRTEAPIERWA